MTPEMDDTLFARLRAGPLFGAPMPNLPSDRALREDPTARRLAKWEFIAWLLANSDYDPAAYDGRGAVHFIASGVTMPMAHLQDMLRLFADPPASSGRST